MRMMAAAAVMMFAAGAVALGGPAPARAQDHQALPAAEPEALGIALEGYPYPWPVHFLPLTIERQDVRMAYMDVPPAPQTAGTAESTESQSERVAVLLHGKNFGGYYWAETARALAAAGFRVVIPDQIGWGKSSKPEIGYSFQLLAANTLRLLDALGIRRAAVIGHSTGGMLAVRFALTYPERVTRLVLEDPIGMEDYRVNIPPQTDETLYQAELAYTDPAKIRAFYARYFAHPRPEVYEPLAEVQIRVTRSGEYARWARASALAYQMIYQQPVRYEYGLLRPPVLVIVGGQDHTVPLGSYAAPEARARMGNFVELGHAAARDIPHATLVVIAAAGHIPHIEQAEEFQRALLAFLGGQQ
ncbi:MAG TPA: alpha/beta hydrolase [Candidatus Acidoferrales bacterium]|nr:alpha/beta hydrolase [Candidatus Acidoferrales bacterium]